MSGYQNSAFDKRYAEIVDLRRELKIDGFKTLGDVGCDGHWITPYQKISCSDSGPVLLARSWFNAADVALHQNTLQRLGYLPTLKFNQIMDAALHKAGMARSNIYLTQVLLVLPPDETYKIRQKDYDRSFDAVTRFELEGRNVIAIGSVAKAMCEKYQISYRHVISPSAPGITDEAKTAELSAALQGI